MLRTLEYTAWNTQVFFLQNFSLLINKSLFINQSVLY